MFSAVCFAFTLFQLLYVFPKTDVEFPKWYRFILTPYTFIVLVLTLTPLVFSGIVGSVEAGRVAEVQNGLGIFLFAILVFFLVGGGISYFIRKLVKASAEEKNQFLIVLFGLIITFTSIIFLNFILPAFFKNYTFIPLGALFIFPFIAFTAYAIYKHKTFHVRNIAPAILAFLLCLVTFGEIVFANNQSLLVFRISIFILTLIISIQFVRNLFNLETANEQQESLIHFISHEVKGYLTKSGDTFAGIIEGDYGEASSSR